MADTYEYSRAKGKAIKRRRLATTLGLAVGVSMVALSVAGDHSNSTFALGCVGIIVAGTSSMLLMFV